MFRQFFICLLIFGFVFGEHQQDFDQDVREGKFLGPSFWQGVNEGLRESVDALERMSNNLEVTFNSFIPGLRGPVRRKDVGIRPSSDDPIMVDAIGGQIGSGIDDGLKVFFTGEGTEDREPEGTEIKPSVYPRPQGPFGASEAEFYPRPNGRPFNPFRNIFGGSDIFKIFRSEPWWKRENVCLDREEIDETEAKMDDETDETASNETDSRPNVKIFGSIEVSSCSETGTVYTCEKSVRRRGMHKTIITTYRCCHGFVRDERGCAKVDLKSMPETLESLEGASHFSVLLSSANLLEKTGDANFTIFVPTDEAVEEYTSALEEENEIQGERNEISRRARMEDSSTEDVLLGHMVDGFHFAADMEDEMILRTRNGKSSIRINQYSGLSKIMTANCARITSANKHSLDGVVHTVDRILKPVEKTLLQIVDKDPQFSILKKLLSKTDLEDELRSEGQMTLLAPTDAAFQALNQVTLESLLKGGPCVETVLRNLVLPNTICSAAIQGRMKTMNGAGDYLVVDRTEDDKLFVEDAQIVVKDVVGTNGVLHIVDKVLIPDHAKPVKEVLAYHNLTKFIELLEEVGLFDEIDGQTDIAIFAPTNKAFEAVPKAHMDALRGDRSKLKELLRYHVSSESGDGIIDRNNDVAETRAKFPVRINFYSREPLLNSFFNLERSIPVRVTAGCSRISHLNSRACGSVIHIVEEVLQIPESDVLASLDHEEYSMFRKMISDVGHDEYLGSEGPFTVFALSNHALKNLPPSELTKIQEDDEVKRKILNKHILREHICCSGINANNWPFMDRKRTLDGSAIHIRRTVYDQMMAGSARILSCGTPTKNGIVHSVNRFVMPDRELAGLLRGENPKTGIQFPNLIQLFN